MASQENCDLSNDLLIGAEAIANFLGVKVRYVYHAAAQGHLRTFHIGPLLAARKSELSADLSAARIAPASQREAEATA